MNDLLSLMAELKDEVESLRSIQECEREIDWWSRRGRGSRRQLHEKQRTPYPLATEQKEVA